MTNWSKWSETPKLAASGSSPSWHALGAGDLEDLERTRSLIGEAQTSLAMAKTAGVNWWSHPEAPLMWFTDVLTPPG